MAFRNSFKNKVSPELMHEKNENSKCMISHRTSMEIDGDQQIESYEYDFFYKNPFEEFYKNVCSDILYRTLYKSFA